MDPIKSVSPNTHAMNFRSSRKIAAYTGIQAIGNCYS